MNNNQTEKTSSRDDREKIESLREIIQEAEKSLFSARAMLSRIEGVKKPMTKKKTYGASPNGKIIEGVFDGQLMIGNDGKQYPVPANYASKSRLVEGDLLKLTITDEGSFIYKQIGPVDRKRMIGIIKEDEGGNYVIVAEGKNYKVLLASVTYYKAKPGDEVAVVLPRDGEPVWCSIENVTKKAFEMPVDGIIGMDHETEAQDPFLTRGGADISMPKEVMSNNQDSFDVADTKKDNLQENFISNKQDDVRSVDSSEHKDKNFNLNEIVSEWTPELSQIEQEAKEVKESAIEMENQDNLDEINSDHENKKSSLRLKITDEDEKERKEREKRKKAVVKKDFLDTAEEFFSKSEK